MEIAGQHYHSAGESLIDLYDHNGRWAGRYSFAPYFDRGDLVRDIAAKTQQPIEVSKNRLPHSELRSLILSKAGLHCAAGMEASVWARNGLCGGPASADSPVPALRTEQKTVEDGAHLDAIQ